MKRRTLVRGAGIPLAFLAISVWAQSETRVYDNTLRRIENPKPILADHPQWIQPIVEEAHYEAAPIVDDDAANITLRAWRFSYNARGIIEMPNHLRGDQTALIVVHP